MNKFLYLSMFCAASLFFTGCGSSPSKKIKESLIEKYAEGVYDISTNNDTLYLTIKDNGFVDTYKLDTNNNCYKKNETPGINSSINGKKLEIDYSDKLFEINSAKWYYGNDKKIKEVRIGKLKSSTILESNNIRIGTNKKKTDIITFGELKQSICL